MPWIEAPEDKVLQKNEYALLEMFQAKKDVGAQAADLHESNEIRDLRWRAALSARTALSEWSMAVERESDVWMENLYLSWWSTSVLQLAHEIEKAGGVFANMTEGQACGVLGVASRALKMKAAPEIDALKRVPMILRGCDSLHKTLARMGPAGGILGSLVEVMKYRVNVLEKSQRVTKKDLENLIALVCDIDGVVTEYESKKKAPKNDVPDMESLTERLEQNPDFNGMCQEIRVFAESWAVSPTAYAAVSRSVQTEVSEDVKARVFDNASHLFLFVAAQMPVDFGLHGGLGKLMVTSDTPSIVISGEAHFESRRFKISERDTMTTYLKVQFYLDTDGNRFIEGKIGDRVVVTVCNKAYPKLIARMAAEDVHTRLMQDSLKSEEMLLGRAVKRAVEENDEPNALAVLLEWRGTIMSLSEVDSKLREAKRQKMEE